MSFAESLAHEGKILETSEIPSWESCGRDSDQDKPPMIEFGRAHGWVISIGQRLSKGKDEIVSIIGI